MCLDGSEVISGTAAAILAIEVSESSIDYDRRIKRGLYAEVQVPEYWVVNIEERCIEVFRNPVAGTYADHQVLGTEAVAVPLAFPDLEVPVERLFLEP